MKYRYLIVDEDGEVIGTNNEEVANYWQDDVGALVVDAQRGCVYDSDAPIHEAEMPDDEAEED